MSRWTALASVAALFLSGVAIGALGMHLLDERLARPLPFAHPPHPRAALEELQRELRLSPEQREKVAAILEESWREGEEIRRDVQPRLDQHIAGTERRLREVLTPEQREHFDALHREHRLRAERLFLGRPGPHGPPGPHPGIGGPPPGSPADAPPPPP